MTKLNYQKAAYDQKHRSNFKPESISFRKYKKQWFVRCYGVYASPGDVVLVRRRNSAPIQVKLVKIATMNNGCPLWHFVELEK